MDIFSSINVTDENIAMFAAGLGAGALLWAAVQAATKPGSQPDALAKRVEKLEMRLAAGKDFASIARAVSTFEGTLPLFSSPATITLFSATDLPRLKPSHRPDAEQIAKEFGEAMRDNTVAAVEIAKAIIDQGVNLNDPKDRKRVADKVRAEGKKLSSAFWEKYGEVMLASNLPSNLKDLLRVFFAQVKRLKTAVTELSKEPGFAELDAVLDRAIDLLDTAKAIIDELDRLSRQS